MSRGAEGLWLGLDLGGTKIAGGIVQLPGGTLLSRRQIPTQPARPAPTILNDCLELAHELTRTQPVRGIGIGIAELVDGDGILTSDATFPFKGFDLREWFAEIAPTHVDSDVRAAAFAEAHFGAGRGCSLFAYVTVGTGIGACLVQDGVPFAGARGNALTLGSSTLFQSGEGEYVLERVASGTALVARYNQGAVTPVSSGQEVLQAFQKGDTHAKLVVESAADALGMGIALYVNLLDPSAVVLGGGLGSAPGPYWERAVATARALIYAENARQLPILRAALGTDAGIIGAAALAADELETERNADISV